MPGDHAIQSRSEDKLGRGPFVDSLAQAVRQLNASQGVVIGLTGSWGQGKTSVLHMLREELAREPQLVTASFEPWLFSGTDELISLFFADLSAQLKLKLPKGDLLVGLIDTYGQSLGALKWIPVAGPWLDRAGSVAKFFNKGARKRLEEARSLTVQRERLTSRLAERSAPIVVIIDDLDRLQPGEVRDIVQLVRLTGQFPNLIYILAFDREKVEAMLTRLGFEGREYLEKIIEVSYHLPPVPRAALEAVLVSELNELIEPLETGPFDQNRWTDVFYQCLRPLFDDLRDVRRYLASLPAMLAAVGKEVALVDVLTLEALRVLQPSVYTALVDRLDLLTRVSTIGQYQSEVGKSELDFIAERVLEDGGRARQAVVDTLRLLFPATEQYTGGSYYSELHAAQWRRDRRVANTHVMEFYLEKTLSPGVAPASVMDRIVETLSDEAGLRVAFDGLDDQVLDDVLERLEAYESEFSHTAVEPAVTALLGLYPRMHPAQGLFDLGGDLRVDRLVLRLLKSIDDMESRVGVIQRVAETHPSFYARMQLLLLASHVSGVGAKLIPEAEAKSLLAAFWPQVRAASAQQLIAEPHPAVLLYHAMQDDPDDKAALGAQLAAPELFAAVLRDALDSVHSLPAGSIAVRRTPMLHWDILVGIFGDEQILANRLDQFRSEAATPLLEDERTALALNLAARRLLAGPPTAKWDHPATTSQPLGSRSRDILRPNNEPAAQLILRAATLYAASPESVQRTTLVSGQVHDAIRRRLASGEINDAVSAYCADHSLPIDPTSIGETESDSANHLLAVVRRTVTEPNSPVTVTTRAALASPGASDQYVRVIAEIWVALANPAKRPSTKGPDAPVWTPVLSVEETRDLLVAALGTAAEIGSADLPGLYADSVLPHMSTEIHIILGNPVQSEAAPDVGDLIDLGPLGPRVSAQKPRDGDFVAGATVAISGMGHRIGVVNDALRYMAGPIWRYAEADQRLLGLLQPPAR